jgi:hypothetical protein
VIPAGTENGRKSAFQTTRRAVGVDPLVLRGGLKRMPGRPNSASILRPEKQTDTGAQIESPGRNNPLRDGFQMATRIHQQLEFQLEHFEGQAGVISTWSVPYTAIMLRRGVYSDIEPDGMPQLLGLLLKVGNCRRDLPDPDASERQQWQLAWVKDSRHCDQELLERFTDDLQSRHKQHLEYAA